MEPNPTDLATLARELEGWLKLRSIPIAMKLFEQAEAMEQVPKIRRPQAVHTLDQVVAQAARLGWTVGVTAADLVGEQCRAVVGLGAAGCRMALGPRDGGRLVCERRGRRRAPGRDVSRAGRALPGAGGLAAGLGPAGRA